MESLIKLITLPIVCIAENRRAVIAALCTIIFLIVPAYIIGSVIYAEAELDQVKIIRETPASEVVRAGLKSSRFIGPKSGKTTVISSVSEAKAVRLESSR